MGNAADSPAPKSFLRQWGAVILFGAFVCIALGAMQYLTEKAPDEPIDDSYAKYLTALAANSKGASEYLERYYTVYSRRTIASRHFEAVCGAVTVLADHDGFKPESVSREMALGCRAFTRQRGTGSVPVL